MALSRSAPVAYAQELLETVHMNSGLSWCTTIVATSLALRIVVTLPLAVYQSHIIARLANLDKEIAQIAHELRGETARAVRMYNLDEKQAKYLYRRSLKKQINNLIVRDNCHPFKSSLVIWFQLPLWISLSVALRNMAYMMPYQDMGEEAAEIAVDLVVVAVEETGVASEVVAGAAVAAAEVSGATTTRGLLRKSSVEFAFLSHPCQDDLVCKVTEERVPFFNAPLYLENKQQIGKVDEIFGPIKDFFFIDPNKLMPLQRFLPGNQNRVGKRGAGGRGVLAVCSRSLVSVCGSALAQHGS
ncbi:hypothetical protein HPB47_010997 [Ixodes persulcatus]|uniref:Uncharacterized protein n=1 Tax=Ixodes persulcatus TaxID=34615 RepID=A0AC60NXG3_IXOPE|nr:hypothetical protein HPB47_010997 [Ixodes persulcatus]